MAFCLHGQASWRRSGPLPGGVHLRHGASLRLPPWPGRLVVHFGMGFGRSKASAKKPPAADLSIHPFPELADYRPVLWFNKGRGEGQRVVDSVPFTGADLDAAQDLWLRMAPLISHLYPEIPGGVIEGPLKRLYNIENGLQNGLGVKGMALLKQDSELPVAGSVKARGGIFEVLEVAERAALASGLLSPDADRTLLATDPGIKEILGGQTLVVGSTGNLGLSVGIFGAALGMNVEVHMSNDAKEWKKDLLRAKGAEVVEHAGSYSEAVAAARKRAEGDAGAHFVDDEGSRSLIMGYSTAAFALVNQLEQLGVPVDANHPLVIHLPCGVGGAPAGLTWGLRRVLGDHVHVLLAEPTHAPCATIGLATGRGADSSIQDLGLDGVTEADGLAVGRVSALAHSVLKELVTGAFTVDDDDMLQALAQLLDLELTFIEPSCAAAFMGPAALAARALGAAPDTLGSAEADRTRDLARRLLQEGTHVFWATGGGLVPDDIRQEYCDRGLAIMMARQQAAGAT